MYLKWYNKCTVKSTEKGTKKYNLFTRAYDLMRVSIIYYIIE